MIIITATAFMKLPTNEKCIVCRKVAKGEAKIVEFEQLVLDTILKDVG